MTDDTRFLELESVVAELRADDRRRGWRSRWAAIGAAVAITLGGGSTALHYASAAPGDVVPNSFVPVSPVRILDTRPAPENVGGFVGPLASGQTHTFTVAGVNGVPANATAVVLNMTVDGTTGKSNLRVFPAGATQPLVSNINWSPGTTIANLATVKVGAGGQISVYNLSGNVQVIADLAGYYVPGNDKFIDVDILGHPGDTATSSGGFGANAGLGFVDGASNTATFHIVLPPDYTPGGAIRGTYTWHTAATACGVVWRSAFVSVSRAGQPFNVGAGATTGMSDPGNLAAGTSANSAHAATFSLTSPDATTTLLPGDSYTFGLYRFGASVSDTCGATAKIDSLVITYE